MANYFVEKNVTGSFWDEAVVESIGMLETEGD